MVHPFLDCIFIGFMGIGGFFMFRKFLKRLPKQDGKSDLDWEEFFVKQTKRFVVRQIRKHYLKI